MAAGAGNLLEGLPQTAPTKPKKELCYADVSSFWETYRKDDYECDGRIGTLVLDGIRLLIPK